MKETCALLFVVSLGGCFKTYLGDAETMRQVASDPRPRDQIAIGALNLSRQHVWLRAELVDVTAPAPRGIVGLRAHNRMATAGVATALVGVSLAAIGAVLIVAPSQGPCSGFDSFCDIDKFIGGIMLDVVGGLLALTGIVIGVVGVVHPSQIAGSGSRVLYDFRAGALRF